MHCRVYFSVLRGTFAAEAYPNGQRVGADIDGRVEGFVGALRVVVVARTVSRHAAGVHASVGQVAIGGNAQNLSGIEANTLAA